MATQAPESIAEGRAERIAAVGYHYAERPKERVDACNLCESGVHAELTREDRYGFPIPARICLRCGLVFHSPRLTAAGYQELYDGWYRRLVSAFHGRTVDAGSVQDEQRPYAEEVLSFLGRALPEGAPTATLLDVGGSTGVVGRIVGEALGARVTVLDPAPAELAEAAAHGLETIAGNAEDFEPAGRTWDLLLLCQTVEHLLDVRATLAAMRAMLADGGHAYVDLAELRHLVRRYRSLEGALKIDHPHYLTAEVARAYFSVTGLEIAAEHVWDQDGWGFLVRAGEPARPDWSSLAGSAAAFVDEVRALRAGTPR